MYIDHKNDFFQTPSLQKAWSGASFFILSFPNIGRQRTKSELGCGGHPPVIAFVTDPDGYKVELIQRNFA
jgi:hypothetical protein